MPIYTYNCLICSKKIDEFRYIDSRDDCPDHCGTKTSRILNSCAVIGDISGYRSIAVDKETGKRPHIGSRKQHREFLARNDYVEVGDQPFKETPDHRRPSGQDFAFDLSHEDL